MAQLQCKSSRSTRNEPTQTTHKGNDENSPRHELFIESTYALQLDGHRFRLHSERQWRITCRQTTQYFCEPIILISANKSIEQALYLSCFIPASLFAVL